MPKKRLRPLRLTFLKPLEAAWNPFHSPFFVLNFRTSVSIKMYHICNREEPLSILSTLYQANFYLGHSAGYLSSDRIDFWMNFFSDPSSRAIIISTDTPKFPLRFQ